MYVVFLYGAPATGKLTVGRQLAKLTGFHLFHNHLTVDLLLSVFDFGSEPFIRLREQIWLSIFSEAAKNDTSLIFTFAPEKTVSDKFVANTIETVASAGGEVLFVELSCLPDELEKRIENSSRSEFGKLSSLAEYRALKQAGVFDFPKIPIPALSIDTTHTPPDATAQQICQHFSLT